MDKTSEIFSHMDCYLMAMELVCSSMHKDFSYMFANSWRFHYNDFQKSLVVIDSYEEYMGKLNFEYLGITGRKIPAEDTNLSGLIKYFDTHKVLILSTDSFYCPWHKGYSQVSIWHCCTLVDYDKEGIWCVDPYLKGYGRFLLPECTLRNGTIYYYTESEKSNEINVDLFLKKIVSKESAVLDAIEMIGLYKKDMCQLEAAERLFDFPKDIYLCKITRGLKSISDGRFQFGYLLDRLSKREAVEDERIEQICEMFFAVSTIWQNVHNMFVRLYFDAKRLQKSKEKFETYLTKIIDMEKEIFSKIKSYVG